MTRGPSLMALLGRRPPTELLLHPVTLSALGLMILNDGYLRSAHPGPITGKLSDFAAVLAYPGVLAAVWGLTIMALDRVISHISPGRGLDYSLSPRVLLGACLVTGSVLVGINLWTPFRDGYLAVLRRLDLFGTFGPYHYTMDATDLVALVMLPGVWILGRRVLAAVPAGRLRAMYRLALRLAPHRSKEQICNALDRQLADIRRARGSQPNQTISTVRDLILEAALQEVGAHSTNDQNVALQPAEHYHRLRQALETHRNRGT